MNPDKLKKVIYNLFQATEQGLVPWKMTQDDDFRVNFGESTLSLGWLHENRLQAGVPFKSVSGPYLSIYNRHGVRILKLDVQTVMAFDIPEDLLGDIYQLVRNQVFRFEETFDNILVGLEA